MRNEESEGREKVSYDGASLGWCPGLVAFDWVLVLVPAKVH